MVLKTSFNPPITNFRQGLQKSRINSTIKAFIIWHIIFLCHCVSQYVCNDNNADALVDLSYEFNEDTLHWITATAFTMNVTHNGTTGGANPYWYQIEDISTGTHAGTHLDAPCHFAKGKWCVSDIPINRLVVPAIVIDISHYVGDDPSRQLTINHLEDWENSYGIIPDSSLVLVRTGWARFWPDRLQYSGTSGKNVSLLKFPSISSEAAQWMVDNRNIVGVGIDTMSVDPPGQPLFETHIIFGENNIYGIENVNNQLNLLPAKGNTAFVMPMKIKGASGAPCRLFVTKSTAQTNGVLCDFPSKSLIVLSLTAILFYAL